MDVPAVLTVCILLTFCANIGQCCNPAEIGQGYTITSERQVTNNEPVIWQSKSTSVLYNSNDDYGPNFYPHLYIGTRTQLTVLNVTKNDGKDAFNQLINNVIVYTCKLPVYKRASTPICEPLRLTENQIRTKCITAQVFPQAKCQFTLLNGEKDSMSVTDVTPYIAYNHTDPQPGGNEYYSTSCTLQYPVDGLKPGNWTVQVNMYPDQTNVLSAQGTTGQAVNTLQLTVPAVNINPDNCPKDLDVETGTNVRDGYIREGKSASCLCARTHVGNPLGSIHWRSTTEGTFHVLSEDENAINIKIISRDNFTCWSESLLNGSHSMTYTPTYAYGPTSTWLTLQPPGPIYLCPDRQTNIDITCQVPANSFNPAPLFTIYDGNNKSLVTKVAGDAASYKSVSLNFTKSGQQTFKCRAENAIFSDILSEAPESAIQIYVPPNNPPSFEVTGQSVKTDDSKIWVKQGSDINVTCSAGEANPLITSENVNLTCGQNTSSSGLLSVPGVSGNELKCKCAVDHETKTPCNGHNLNNETIIQIAYGPNEITIGFLDDKDVKVQNETLNMCSSEGLDVTVICAVMKSNVRPGLENDSFILTKPDAFAVTQKPYLNASNEGEYRSVNKLKVTSEGEYTFKCEASNPKYLDIKKAKSTGIQVRVPPKTKPTFQVTGQFVKTDNSETWVKQGSDIIVTCFGGIAYPAVNSSNARVTCGQNTSSSGLLSVTGVSGNELKCECAVDHETKTSCNEHNLNNETTIKIAYGPKEVTMRFLDDKDVEVQNETLNMCSSEGLDVTVICVVMKSNVRPGLESDSFILTKPDDFAVTQQSYLNESIKSEYRSVNKLKVTSGGKYTLKCEASNPKYPDLKITKSTGIQVRTPPSDTPKISIKSSRSIQNEDALVEGDDVTVTCNVLGGYPAVSSVTLTCGQDQFVTMNRTSATLILKKIGVGYNDTNCTCQADHVTGCYDLIEVLPLTVMNSTVTESEQEDSPPIGAAVGGVIAALVVLAVVAGGIFFVRRRMKKKQQQSPETGGDGTILQEDEVMKDNVVYIPHEDVRPVDGLVSGNEEGKKVDPYEDVEIGNASILIEVSQAQSSQNDATGDPVNATVAKTILQKQEINPYENMETKDATNPVEEAQAQSSQGDSSMYTTVAKIKNERLTSFNADKTDAITTAATSGEAPVVPERRYYEEDVGDSVNEPPTGKGKKKNILETLTEKMKKKEKKETKKKDKDKVFATDYTEVKPTMTSAAAYPKNYNPENNPYEDVEMKTVPQPNEQAQARSSQEELTGASVYTTVAKLKRQKSTSSDADKTDDITMAATSGEAPEIPERHYDEENVTDLVNEPPTGKEKKKNILEKLTEKKKKKEKKEKKEKKKKAKEQDRKLNLNQTNGNEGTTASQEDDHIYSNETLSRRADGDLYANMAKSMNSLNDVDDGTYRNEDGLLYTTIAGVASLKAVQTPVHHPRKEEPVDYADIDFDQILANRENPA